MSSPALNLSVEQHTPSWIHLICHSFWFQLSNKREIMVSDQQNAKILVL